MKARVEKEKKTRSHKVDLDKSHSLKLRGEEKVIKVGRIRANAWNPNRMSPYTRGKLLDNLKTFGFLDPVLVRSGNEKGPFPEGGYEIIDGEQRFTVAKEAGYKKVKITDIGNISDEAAKVLTINLNDMRGKHDRDALANIVGELSKMNGGDELLALLPYDEAELDSLRTLNAADLEALDSLPPDENDTPVGSASDHEDDIASILQLDSIKSRRAADLAARLEGLFEYLSDKPPKDVDMNRAGGLLEAMIAATEAFYNIEPQTTEDGVEDAPKRSR